MYCNDGTKPSNNSSRLCRPTTSVCSKKRSLHRFGRSRSHKDIAKKTMGKPTGFKEFERQAVPYRDPMERVQDFLEIFTAPVDVHLRTQGARCMDCGVP